MKKFFIMMLLLFVIALPLFIQADSIIDNSGPPKIQIIELGSLDINIDQQIEKQTINLKNDVLTSNLLAAGLEEKNTILITGIKSETKDLCKVVYQGIYVNGNNELANAGSRTDYNFRFC
jgi:hypothetical protein